MSAPKLYHFKFNCGFNISEGKAKPSRPCGRMYGRIQIDNSSRVLREVCIWQQHCTLIWKFIWRHGRHHFPESLSAAGRKRGKQNQKWCLINNGFWDNWPITYKYHVCFASFLIFSWIWNFMVYCSFLRTNPCSALQTCLLSY